MKQPAFALLVAVLAAEPASASQQGVVVTQNWKSMDLCTRKAQAAFPDFTAEANARRDAKLKECLEQQNLPPRTLPSPGH